MNRIERLTAILVLLQGGKRTAAEIAQRFEVSRRTVLRDIQGLCEMGIPVTAIAGVSGGYTLPPDYSLPPLALTWHEATLLRLALSSLAQLGSTPFRPECESLLAKVQLLLPQRPTAEAEQLQDRLSLDVPTHRYPTPFLDQLLESAGAKQWVSVVYRSEKGVSRQTIQPTHLRSSAGLWYCEAYSYERQAMRVYRVDRFHEVCPASPPMPMEPPTITVPHVHPSYPEVLVRLTPRGILRLEHEPHLGLHLQSDETGAGSLSVHLCPEEYEWLVRVLLGLGTEATVVAPAELRTRVQQAAQEIARHYA
ncbi:MAG: helix-turn-helix transcriptional regulator [Mycobacterium leprae]